ncbi:hypothetical protein D3C85_1562670 [compost metagenome]
MLDFIFKSSFGINFGVTKIMFGNKFSFRINCYFYWIFFSFKLNSIPVFFVFPLIHKSVGVFVFNDFMSHFLSFIIFLIQSICNKSDGFFRNNFFDENNATFPFSVFKTFYIKSQINFFKINMKRNF